MDSKLENNEGRPILDAVALRSLGIKRISELSGNIWSDYNAADPGITIMEILCFSIMDIGYRMTFDIRDLLTEPGYKVPRYRNVFYEPYQVLSSAPLTINDYRKLILENIPGIKNVWLKPVNKTLTIPENVSSERQISLKGYYNVYVDVDADSEDVRNAILKEVKTLLDKHRNLCEDFNYPEAVEHLPVAIEADVEVEAGYDYSAILQQIISDLTQYVSPDLHRYTLEEMLKKGTSISDVFTGPYPKWGYVDVNEVEDMDDNRELYASDIINIIMRVPGVKGVRHFKFVVNNTSVVDVETYKISLKDSACGHYVFRLASPSDNKSHNIEFLLESFRFTAPYTHTQKSISYNAETYFNGHLGIDTGTNRNLNAYYTIQHEFPNMYLVGKENISDEEPNLRKAQRLQMKAYLMFFDQLLADFLLRMDSAKYMLSWEKTKNIEEWKEKQQSYLHHILSDEDIDDVDKVVQDDYVDYFQNSVFDAKKELKRKNKALDSLLARFNEDFVNFSIMQYISKSAEIDEHTIEEQEYELICSKSAMLEHYPVLGYRRAGAIDYKNPCYLNESSGTEGLNDGNYYAVERKLSIKLGILNYTPNKVLHPQVICKENDVPIFEDNRGAAMSEAFGLHVYEHSLLVPQNEVNKNNFLYQYTDEDRKTYVADPYSMKITVVMPGWLNIVQDHRFRSIVEHNIREEFPAHIAVKVCWINPLQMMELEEAYEQYMQNIDRGDQRYEESLSIFAQKLSKLNNAYHEAYMDKADNKSIIGYTTLESEMYKWNNNKK